MGKEDVYESDYLENAEIFADLVNGVLYQGEQVVKPEELAEQDGELRSILGEHTKKTIRDKVKLWNGAMLAIFAVENQTKVDYHMVLRAMLMESMAYDKQWKRLRMKYERERTERLACVKMKASRRNKAGLEAAESENALTPDEFLSGMRREDKFIPVITIIIYYGKEKPWDGAKTLHELLDIKGNAEKILPFVSDYKLNIFDYHDYNDFGQFHTELQSVFEFLRYSTNKKALADKLEEHKENYRMLSSQAKVLLARIANIKKIPNVTGEKFRKGDFDVCKAFKDMKEEGRIEGEKRGRIEGEKRGRIEGEKQGRAREIVELGCEFGLSEKKILEKLQNKLNISEKKARKYFTMFAEQAV